MENEQAQEVEQVRWASKVVTPEGYRGVVTELDDEAWCKVVLNDLMPMEGIKPPHKWYRIDELKPWLLK